MSKTAPPSLFTKVYSDGWKRLRQLAKMPPSAFGLWTLIAEHASKTNALEASLETLADALDVDSRTITRATAALEEAGALRVFRSKGGNVYVLNNDEIWKDVEERKHFVAFTPRRLVGKDNPALRAYLEEKAKEAEAEANKDAPVARDTRNVDMFEPTH